MSCLDMDLFVYVFESTLSSGQDTTLLGIILH